MTTCREGITYHGSLAFWSSLPISSPPNLQGHSVIAETETYRQWDKVFAG